MTEKRTEKRTEKTAAPTERTLGEVKAVLARAIRAGDLGTIERITARLRFRGWGPIAPFRYADLLSFAQDAVPGLTPAAWDALMYELDEANAEEAADVADLYERGE